jgi:hypothetical protein
MNHVDYKTAPLVGATIQLDQQTYRLEATQPYRRKDGTASRLLIWRSECPRCGQSFTVKTGLVTKSLNRRCEPCRLRAKSPVSGRGRAQPITIKRNG